MQHTAYARQCRNMTLGRIWSVTATDDPSVLGIKPIPNIQEKIQKMIAKYRAETIDIEDVEYEEADLEEDVLFNDKETESTKSQL